MNELTEKYLPDSQGNYMTKKERTGYYLYAIGGFIFNTSFGAAIINTFMSDSGIPMWLITIILAITQLWDAINDPLAGIIIEKTKFKSGKYIPFIKTGLFLLPILLIFFFSVPTVNFLPLKVAWVLIFYILIEGVFTFIDIPSFGLGLVGTKSVRERTKVYSMSGFFCIFGALIATIAYSVLHETLKLPYYVFGVTIAILIFAFCIWMPFLAKERFVIEKPKEEKIPFKQMIKGIINNKYLLIYYIGLIICFGTSTISMCTVYVSRYILQNPSLMLVVTLAISFPAIITALLIPVLNKKIDKFHMFLFFNVGTIVTSILCFFIGYSNLYIFIASNVIRGFFFGGISLLAYTFTGDMIEYHHFAKGNRQEGISYSFQTFSAKLINAIQVALGTFILGLFGYISIPYDKEWFEITQPQSVVNGVWLLFTLIPCIGGIVGVIILFFYKLRDNDVQLMIKANHGEISKSEAFNKLCPYMQKDLKKGGFNYE